MWAERKRAGVIDFRLEGDPEVPSLARDLERIQAYYRELWQAGGLPWDVTHVADYRDRGSASGVGPRAAGGVVGDRPLARPSAAPRAKFRTPGRKDVEPLDPEV